MGMLARTLQGDVLDVRCSPDGLLIASFAPPIDLRYDIGALAVNATFNGPTIDLGPALTRQHHLILAAKYGVASAGEVINLRWSDDDINWRQMHGAPGSSGGSSAQNSTSAMNMVTKGVTMGRYVRVVYTNGSTAQTALFIAVTCLAGI